jgi:hypothetical protein
MSSYKLLFFTSLMRIILLKDWFFFFEKITQNLCVREEIIHKGVQDFMSRKSFIVFLFAIHLWRNTRFEP